MNLITDTCNPEALKILLAAETANLPVSVKLEKCKFKPGDYTFCTHP